MDPYSCEILRKDFTFFPNAFANFFQHRTVINNITALLPHIHAKMALAAPGA